MSDREFNFDLAVEGVRDTDSVKVNILPANDSLPADTENVSLVDGQATVEFSDARGSRFPIPFRIQVAVTRAEDGRSESILVERDNQTLIVPHPMIEPANGTQLDSRVVQFRFTPEVAGRLYRADIAGSEGEFGPNNVITAAVPSDGKDFDVVFTIDRQDGSAPTVITHTYIASTIVLSPDELDAAASNATLIVNGGNPIAYGQSTFQLSLDWLNGPDSDGNRSYAGTPPVEGLKLRDSGGQEIGSVSFNSDLSSAPNNVYNVTLPNFGPATDLFVTYGENPNKTNRVTVNYNTGITLEAVSAPVRPPASAAASSIQGYGTDSAFSRNLSSGSNIVFITNLNDSGTGSARAALERTDQRYIVPLVSGIITAETSISSRGKFAYLGEAGQLLIRKNPNDGDTTIRMIDQDQMMRHAIVSMGQTTRSGEDSNRCMTLTNRRQVVHQCTLPFGVDDGIDAWRNGGASAANECTMSYNIVGPNLKDGYNSTSGRAKGMLVGGMCTDISIHHNLFMGGLWRSPEFKGQFGDIRNNVEFGYDWGIFANRQSDSTGGAHFTNIIKNLRIASAAQNQIRPDYDILVDSNSSANPANSYVDDNGIQTDNGSIAFRAANFRNNANQSNSEYTSSPVTGLATPSVDTYELEELEDHVLANAGSHSFASDTFRDQLIAKVTARDYSLVDGVGGESRWPATYAGGNRTLWPSWPNASENGSFGGAFDLSAVNGVPDSYRQSIGVADGTDLTRTSVAGDGIPDFERFLESVTGVAPF